MAVLRRVVDETPRPIRESNPEVPAWLAGLIAKLHAKKPEDRFQSAREVADLLRERLAQVQRGGVTAVAGAPEAAPPASAEPVDRAGQRERLFERATEHLRLKAWSAARVAEALVPLLVMGVSVFVTILGIMLLATDNTAVLLPIGLAGLAGGLVALVTLIRKRMKRIDEAASAMYAARDEVLHRIPEALETLGGLVQTRSELAVWELIHHLGQQERQSVELFITCPGTFTLWDLPLEVYLDGQLAGTGSEVSGVNLTVRTCAGVHLVQLRGKAGSQPCLVQHSVVRLPPNTTCEVALLPPRQAPALRDAEVVIRNGSPPPLAAPAPPRRRRRWLWPAFALWLAPVLLMLGFWVVPTLSGLVTQATLIVEANVTDLRVEIIEWTDKGEGREVAVVTTGQRREVRLPPGRYRLCLHCNPGQKVQSIAEDRQTLLETSSGYHMGSGAPPVKVHVNLRRGERRTVKVTIVAAPVKAAP
jgi:hypothetical protein